MTQGVRNNKGNYAIGNNTWSRSRSFDSGSNYKIPRKRVKFDR